jgi:RNA polymerase sigma factor (sigma-70 family)
MDNITIYLKQIGQYAVLDKAQETSYFEALDEYRTKLVQHNLKLVVFIAKKFTKTWKSVDLMDLIQEGNITLMRAVSEYNPKKGTKFSTFASLLIYQDLVRYMSALNGNPVDETDMTNIDNPNIQDELVEPITADRTILKNEAYTNLTRKILQFKSTLSEDEMFIWDKRIVDKIYTLERCQQYVNATHPMEVKRIEDKVKEKAASFFTQIDFYDVIGG